MPVMWVMEVAIDEVVDMIAVRHCGMTTIRAVDMRRVMAASWPLQLCPPEQASGFATVTGKTCSSTTPAAVG